MFLSILVNTLVWGAELSMVTMGLSLSYAVMGFANWAHVEFVAVGAYIGLWAYRGLELPLPVAIVIAMVFTGALAVVLELIVFRRLRTATVGSKMLATVGVAIVIRAIVQYIAGVDAYFYSDTAPSVAFEIRGVRVTVTQVVIVVLAVVSLLVFFVFLRRTRLGRILRATADNLALAEVRGINADRIIMLVWFISGAFAALGGVMLGFETFVRPQIGLSILLPMFAAATVGGLGSLVGAIVGSMLLAFAQNLLLGIDFGTLFSDASWFIDSGYKSALALGLLVIVMLVRPQGLFGGNRT